MKLNDVLAKITPEKIVGNADIDIEGVNIDSRMIKKGHLFVAEKGTQTDGHKFIGSAIENGAIAVLCETIPEDAPKDVTFIVVKDSEDVVPTVKPPLPPYYIICSVNSGIR